MSISPEFRSRLSTFCQKLINQTTARIIVPAQAPESGFWFGGGNMAASQNGDLYVVGRFRNAGDSRTGVAAGTRGLELAIFRSTDQGTSWQKCVSWTKAELNNTTGDVLSIEGSCLRFTPDGVELFVSTEKIGVPYPEAVADFLKPGAGVWTIDVLRASGIEQLPQAAVEPVLQSHCPEHLHVKDPFFWPTPQTTQLGFCSHPFNWSSSNTGRCEIPVGGTTASSAKHAVFPRGMTWDVAMTRGTSILPLPNIDALKDTQGSLLFYCGGECLRPLDEHSTAVKRPRGYSCEEIGGVAFLPDQNVESAIRLSDLLPMFISPHGTGCSRYVDVLATEDGYYATWQQSQDDLSQPLVLNFVPRAEADALLSDNA